MIVNQGFRDVVVLMPEASKIVSMSWRNKKFMKHLLDVCSNSNCFLPKSEQDSKKTVVHVERRSFQKNTVEGIPILLRRKIGDYPDAVGLLGMIDTE